ncbi:Transcriptional activator UGA3 [Fusarium agapanthi]|uniref:Transcriptional activator UGA3 n=1 Tax=Fusarium agapanthi TaxID=1803897 RepID=A0A9P5B1D4_9HYPO|nr:Transcriptional activator UGA3 [Fusarium agapanthi]
MNESLKTPPSASTRRGGYTRQKRVVNVCKREPPRSVLPSPGAATGGSEVTETRVMRTPSIDQQIKEVTQLCQPLGLSLEPGDANSENHVGSRRVMLRYYTVTLAFLLTTNLENNCFLSVILPMAFECPALTYAVSAWASSHLALRDEKFRADSLSHRGHALAQLQKSMKQSELSTEMCLAVTMVLCSMESISEATDAWYPHLKGAAAALAWQSEDSLAAVDPKQAVQDTFEGRWLLRNFAYHDIMMSDDTLADPGFASRILYLISETSILNADFAEAESGSQTHGYSFVELSQKIESELQNWVCPSGHNDSPLALLGEAYRNAALIHLYRTLSRYIKSYSGILKANLSACVESICKLSRQVSEGCLVECTLLFPLFMAGGEAHETSEIEIIREKLGEMIKWRKFRHFEACLDVFDEQIPRRKKSSKNLRIKLLFHIEVPVFPLFLTTLSFQESSTLNATSVSESHKHQTFGSDLFFSPFPAATLSTFFESEDLGRWHYLEHPWWATEGGYAFEPPGDIHTLEVPEDVKEMVTMFHVTGAYIYVDPDGNPVGVEDVFSKLDKARKHYEAVGLGASFADQFVR